MIFRIEAREDNAVAARRQMTDASATMVWLLMLME